MSLSIKQFQLNSSKAILLLLFLLTGRIMVFGQDSLVPASFENKKISRKSTRDPVALSDALTDGLTGEKEKFDAIFTWVVWNIRYDKHRYNSGKASTGHLPVTKILRKRKGICTDYAHLMDTLCAIAGIHNITVTGYTKEVNFDLYDTLYFDNHAWNAVKLNGLWYVYDPTWCSGTFSYGFTRFGKWRKAKVKYFLEKTKSVTLNLETKKSRRNKYCTEGGKRMLKSMEVRILPWFPRMMIRILNFFPYKLKETYLAVANTKYYLANPEVFALNHFPNDPAFSLTGRISSVAAFSADSAYYDKTLLERDSVTRQREGRFCIDCENFYFMDDMEREKRITRASVINNPENHLIPANYSLYFGELVLEGVLKETDSLTKMTLIDSTRRYMDSCKFHLRKSRQANKEYYKFQITKNKEKRKQLLEENKLHKKFITAVFSTTNKRRLKVKSLLIKSDVYHKRGIRALGKFNDSFSGKNTAKKLKEEQQQKMTEELKRLRFRSDSLTTRINELQSAFDVNTSNLWGNVMTQFSYFGPLVNAFYYDMICRENYLLDSYDKLTRDLRVEINGQEKIIDSTLQENVLNVADTLFNGFVGMNDLIRERNSLNAKAAKLMVNLGRAGVIQQEEITAFRQTTNDIMKSEICRNEENHQILEPVHDNFRSFLKWQKYIKRIVVVDNHAEENRTKIVERYITLNKKRASNAIEMNAKIVNEVLRTLIVHKAKFLSTY